MAHTSGPWEVATIKESYAVSTPEGDDGKRLCVCVIAGVQCPGSLFAAHLIAAAPDLLAACHKLIDSDAAVEEDERKHQLLLAKLLAAKAIAKAEGVTMEGTNGKERSLD